MNLTAPISNALWAAANLPSYRRFQRALHQPEAAQDRLLRNYLGRNARTVFGRAHGFQSICNYADFAARVPLMDSADLDDWTKRIRQGESKLLTGEPVTRLVPTSGSASARKLIPFTQGLHREFSAAIGPWMLDLLRQYPAIAGGPAYWSVTPVMTDSRAEDSAVPIGFDDDTAYLGGARRRLARAIMAVPDELRFFRNVEEFRYVTLLCLLRQRELRLVSVWHPSFLSLLLESLPARWPELLADIRGGYCKHADTLPPFALAALNFHPLPRRADELRALDPQKPETLWPRLKLISCWGDGPASLSAAGLKTLFPDAVIQAKGLLATEGCVTIPFAGFQPVAVCSHFYEFMDKAGAIRRVHELERGESYEVLLTTAGGLWRYPLRDCVQVTSFIGRTPSLRFVGRGGNVSDLFGEKLSEEFVAQALHETLAAFDASPGFVLLAPDEDSRGHRYTVYVEGKSPPRFAEVLDQALRQNPHYACCRDLGQLLPMRLFIISGRGYENFVTRLITPGAPLGNIKPAIFSRLSGWSTVFSGKYEAMH